MVLVKPGELPASDRASAWIRALADFEGQAVAQQYAEAVHASWLATTERWPDQAMAWFGLGNSAAVQGDQRKAREAFQRSLTLAPDHAPARYNLAQLAAQDGDDCRALELIEPLLSHEQLGPRADSLKRQLFLHRAVDCPPR